jgi:hypothetical protein
VTPTTWRAIDESRWPARSRPSPAIEKPSSRTILSAGVAVLALGQHRPMNRYEIRVVGHVETRRARALGCDACRWLPDRDSVLTFTAVDQAATYGLMARLRDAGLELVAVERIIPPTASEAALDGMTRDLDAGLIAQNGNGG